MTSKQRLINAATRKEVDTIPISPRTGYASTVHCGSNDIYAQLRLKGIYDYDPMIIISSGRYPFFDPLSVFDNKPNISVDIEITPVDRMRSIKKRYRTPDGPLSEEYLVPYPENPEYGENPNPVHREYLVKEPSDIKRLRHLMPEPDVSYAINYQNIQEIVGEDGLCVASIYGALDHQAGAAMRMEDIMICYYQDRKFVDELIGMFHRHTIAQTKLMLEKGVRYFFCPYYYCSLSAGWSPEIFKEWFLPLISEHSNLIHEYEGIMIYYDDGNLMSILPFLAKAGVDVVETCTPPPVGDFDLVRAKSEYGDCMVYKGYVDLIYTLQKGTVEDVRKAVQFACNEGGRNGGFILGTSDSIRIGTPVENIDAYFAYGREYGSHR